MIDILVQSISLSLPTVCELFLFVTGVWSRELGQSPMPSQSQVIGHSRNHSWHLVLDYFFPYTIAKLAGRNLVCLGMGKPGSVLPRIGPQGRPPGSDRAPC